jgi:hypothetical protein
VAAPDAAPRVLTPAEVGDLVRTRQSELAGTIVAVAGRLEHDPSVSWGGAATCANTLLADAGGGFHVKPVGDIGPGPWDGSGPKTGTFVLRVTAGLEGGRPVVEYVGDLAHRDDGTLALSVADIVGGQIQMEGAHAAVDGWLVRDEPHSCGSISRPSGIAYGCPTDDWLTASEYQPMRPGGSMIGPLDALLLSSGSYDQWAPEPARSNTGGVGVAPRRATYLLWLVMDGCGPTADCYEGPENLHWRIVGRFDPIPGLPSNAGPSSSPTGS